MELGNRIRDAREEKGYKQKDFASLLSMDPSQYGKIERGKLMPTLLQLMDICKRLDCSMDWLVYGKICEQIPVIADIAPTDEYKERYELALDNIKLLKENKTLLEGQIEMLKSKSRSTEEANISVSASKSQLK